MIIFRLSGGFGNQLWSYAAAYSLAKERGEEFAMDTSTQEAEWFFRDFDISHYAIELKNKICYKLGDRKIDHLLWNHVHRRMALGLFTPTVTEKDKSIYDPSVFKKRRGRVYYVGDWQHLQYFEKYEGDIRRMYVYQEKFSDEAQRIKTEIQNTPQSVAIHVRRGDYVRIGIAHNETYYREAVRRISERLTNPVFYCFSEDLEWVRHALADMPYVFRYMDFDSANKGLEDFELMRVCEHQIISRSTYSWWAAYLNDNKNKIIVCPDIEGEKDLNTWPDTWIKVRGE